jgi:hypothetical protein
MSTMRPSLLSRLFAAPLLVAAGLTLAACETTGNGPQAAAKPVEEPMTHTRAARECWMGTEKGAASASLDKRADLVDKCIAQKMKSAPTGEPKS